MGEIRIHHDFGEFLCEVGELYEHVDSARKRRHVEYASIGLEVPARIKFEEVDLQRLLPRLLAIHKTLQWRGHNSLLGRKEYREQSRKSRVLAIAGICELIKEEFTGKFWDTHRRIIGWGPDTTVYDWVWEKGFKEEKIPLVVTACRREFVQTLVLESGVPKNRIRDIIEFFIIYWRYLSSIEDVEALIDEILSRKRSLVHIPLADRYRLERICEQAAEFSKAFAVAVRKLSTIFRFISSCEEIFAGEIELHTELIHRKTGINPLEVLRDKDQLRTIYRMILGIVTPQKLERILQGKPAGTRIAIPDKSVVRTDSYKEILYGEHILEGAVFSCVPNSRLQLDDLRRLPFNRIVRIGSGVLVKSRSRIRAAVNGKSRPDLARKLFLQQEFAANLFYVEQLPAMLITVRTEDGTLDATVGAMEGVLCNPFLHYSCNFKRNTHSLSASFSSFRIMSSAHAGRSIAVRLDGCPEYPAMLTIDSDGQGYLSERIFPITYPAPQALRLTVTESDSGDPVAFGGEPVTAGVVLAPAMLFSPYYGKEFPPVAPGRAARYGGKKFVLLTADVGQATLRLQNLKEADGGTLGSYAARILSWEDPGSPCSIEYVLDGRTLCWGFEKCLNINLYLNKVREPVIPNVKLGALQGAHIDDFEITVNPAPTDALAGKLVWAVSVNNEPPLTFPFTKAPKGHPDGPSLKFPGRSLATLLSRSGWSAKENAKVEVSLGVEEHVFSHVCFWVFPDVAVKMPADLQQGATLFLTARVGRSNVCNISVRDRRGRNQIPPLLNLEDGQWQVKKHPFYGKLDLEQFGTHLDLCAIPVPSGIRLGNILSGSTEPVRDMLRRELGNFDLLVLGDHDISPTLSVNGARVEQFFRRTDDLAQGNLGALPSLWKSENHINCRAGSCEASIEVRYRVTVLAAEFSPLCDETVSGSISYSGPCGATIEVALFEEPTASFADRLSSLVITCDGGEHLGHPLEIKVQGQAWAAKNGFYLRLYLNEGSSPAGMLEFGESWHIESVFGEAGNAVQYLEKAEAAMNGGKVFLAGRFLELAIQDSQSTTVDWNALKSAKRDIDAKKLEIKLKSFAAQSCRILKKEFLVEL